MYNRILVPMALDHGLSDQTLKIARTLAGKNGEIIALHVYEAPHGSVSTYLNSDVVKEAHQRSKDLLTEKTKDLDDVKAEIVVGHTYRTIIDYTVENAIDCIVIGSHKPGLSDYLLGSTAARVVRHAPCAVHVHRSA